MWVCHDPRNTPGHLIDTLRVTRGRNVEEPPMDFARRRKRLPCAATSSTCFGLATRRYLARPDPQVTGEAILAYFMTPEVGVQSNITNRDVAFGRNRLISDTTPPTADSGAADPFRVLLLAAQSPAPDSVLLPLRTTPIPLRYEGRMHWAVAKKRHSQTLSRSRMPFRVHDGGKSIPFWGCSWRVNQTRDTG